MSTVSGLLVVAKAAAQAGAAVLGQRPVALVPATREELGAETKTSGSDWVTDYDRRAEEAVRQVITSYRPHDPISGEEYGYTTPENPSDYRWSIDPLDGTTNFIRGIPQYCTSVAVEGPDPETGDLRWLAAAVVAPVLGRSWWASAGQGAYTALDKTLGVTGEDGEPLEPVRLHGPIPGRSGRLLGTGFGYDAARRTFQLKTLGELLPDFGDVRRIGSAALDLCMVADGTLDAYAEIGTMEHDWAAGALIAEEAGVTVHRPAHPHGNDHPDWTVAGEIDRSLLPPLPS